jgi:ABC-type branched-subunit amino acid transport system substrate-binding protein
MVLKVKCRTITVLDGQAADWAGGDMNRFRVFGAMGLAASLVVGLSGGIAAESVTLASAASSAAPFVVGGEGENLLTPGASQGFEAGIYRFNKAGGLDGRKIKYLGFLDDNFSNTATLTDVQQLVESDHVFAVTPFNNEIATKDVSTFLAQHKTPLIGYGVTPPFDNNPWAWSIDGDYEGKTPKGAENDSIAKILHKKASQLKYAVPGNDIPSAAFAVHQIVVGLEKAGSKVVYDQTNIPVIGTTNYAPYAQAIISSGANAVTMGLGNSDTVGLTAALKSAGFKGAITNGVTYFPGQLAKNPSEEATLQGSYISNQFPAGEDNTPATRQAIADLKSVGAPPYLTTGVSIGYWSAQLFIATLKATAAKVGGADKVTPEAMYRVVNAGFTYKDPLAGGLGSETFPQAESYVGDCSGLLHVEGAKFVDVSPYKCY